MQVMLIQYRMGKYVFLELTICLSLIFFPFAGCLSITELVLNDYLPAYNDDSIC